MSKPVTDLVGRQFGSLTVREYVGVRKRMHVWRCECACGNTREVFAGNLVAGNTLSCGRWCRHKMATAVRPAK